MKRIVLKVFLQGGVIFLSAVALGFLSNQIRSEQLPLFDDTPEEISVSLDAFESSGIPVYEVKTLFSSKEAFFLDIRLVEDYGKGHIPGAKNLPFNLVYEQLDSLVDELPKDATIIIYGDAEAPFLSSNLALVLKDLGYSNVRVFAEGWSLWVDQGLPVEKGR